MTEQQPTTGATPEQIEQAARDAWSIGADPDDIKWDEADDRDRYPVRAEAKWWAGNLVKPDHRIVPANRVLDDADVAAWRRVLAFVTAHRRWVGAGSYEASQEFYQPMFDAREAITDDDTARIAADAARTEGQR